MFKHITTTTATRLGLDRHAKYGYEQDGSALFASIHLAGYYNVRELESMIQHLREVETKIFEHAVGATRTGSDELRMDRIKDGVLMDAQDEQEIGNTLRIPASQYNRRAAANELVKELKLIRVGDGEYECNV